MFTKNHFIILIIILLTVAVGTWYALTTKTGTDMDIQPLPAETDAAPREMPDDVRPQASDQHDVFYSEDNLLGWTVQWAQPSDAGALFDGTASVQELLIESPSGNVSLRLEELVVTDAPSLRAQIATRYPTLAVPEREAYVVPFAGMVSDAGVVLIGAERILTINPTDTFDWPLELDEETISFIRNVQVP